MQRFVKRWKARRGSHPVITQAVVPLAFPPGETGQFDGSHEEVELGGVVQTIKVAHFRLTDSRQMFVVASPRETPEMVFEAPVRAFACFGGAPLRMVDDHLKTVVDTILIGQDRQFNRRFLTLANHDRFEPVACTPESGWEKGQVENQVGNVREWRFTPRLTFTDVTALKTGLASRCQELAGRRHPTELTRTIADGFADEPPLLRGVAAPFDGDVEKTLRVSGTCLIRVDRNRDRVPAVWAGKVVSVRLTAATLRLVADAQMVAEQVRCFGREPLIGNPWHDLPILERRPGALRHGIPFQEWD